MCCVACLPKNNENIYASNVYARKVYALNMYANKVHSKKVYTHIVYTNDYSNTYANSTCTVLWVTVHLAEIIRELTIKEINASRINLN